jgi:hypothetical protein
MAPLPLCRLLDKLFFLHFAVEVKREKNGGKKKKNGGKKEKKWRKKRKKMAEKKKKNGEKKEKKWRKKCIFHQVVQPTALP